MKKVTQIFFWITAVYGGVDSVFQIAKIVPVLHLGVAHQGVGFSIAPRTNLTFLLAIIGLNLLMIWASAYFAVAGFRLSRGNLRGLIFASILAFLCPPFGLVTGVLGLVYAHQSKAKNQGEAAGNA